MQVGSDHSRDFTLLFFWKSFLGFALELAREYSMQEVFATMRMYRKSLPDIQHGKVYGITTFELG
jgi:hypothetical protein